jgi:phospholipid/cholesterol/gamma-HCH transport system substrate-binding protein
VNPAEDRRKAGIFLLVALSLLVVLVGVLAGVRSFTREAFHVAEFYESVAGLDVSSPVKFNGVPVGTVTAIRFHPTDISRIQVVFKVRPDVPIKIGTRAQLKPQGITGISYLELYGGKLDEPDLEEEVVIPSDPSFSTKIGSIAANLSELLERLNDFVKKNEENLSYAIADFRASAGSIRTTLEHVDRVVASGEKAVEEAHGAIADLRGEVKSTGESLRRAVGEAEAFLKDEDLRSIPGKAARTLDTANERLASADFRGLIDRASKAVDEFRRIEENLDRATNAIALAAEDGKRDVSAALANIRAASEHVKEATRLLREDPSRILKGFPEADKPFPDPLPALPEDRR